MEVSSIGNNYSIDTPDYLDLSVQPITRDFDIPETNGDQVTPTNELGAAAVVTAEAVAQDEIRAQELQRDFLYNLDELRSGNISTEQFNNFLEDNGLNNLNIQERAVNDESVVSALFSITNQNNVENDNTNLSSYADYMDKVNEQTQSADVNEKLSAYTSNLRN